MKKKNHVQIILDGYNLTFDQIISIFDFSTKIELEPKSIQNVNTSRKCIEERLKTKKTYYGINTGFGSLADVRISDDQLDNLQVNLIRSHACGVGEPLPLEVVRLALVLRLQTMLRGHSGVTIQTLEILKDFVNYNILPSVPSKGSVGACGDLAPLAHIALCLIGEGQVYYQGTLQPTSTVLKKLKIKPLKPKAKEGLCLINGTQIMTALGLYLASQIKNIIQTADIAAALSLDAFQGSRTAFRSEIQEVRNHTGQKTCAKNIFSLTDQDSIQKSHIDCGKVQDPYSFRCVPQVHGATRDAFSYCLKVLLDESNSSTDNPLVFANSDEILSGGNFHGQPVALALDFLAIATAELGSISERRLEKLVNPHFSGHPAFLIKKCGLNSGFMIPHVVSAALVSENKIYSHPASVDSIPTSAEKEDHVSMGMTSALKLKNIVNNLGSILAIEILAAVQGIELLHPKKPSKPLMNVCNFVRTFSTHLNEDRAMADEIAVLAKKVLSGELLDSIGRKLD